MIGGIRKNLEFEVKKHADIGSQKDAEELGVSLPQKLQGFGPQVNFA